VDFHSIAFTIGNFEYYFKSYFLFISKISYLVGVPKILIIYISWSICESAKNGGWPLIISKSIQPVDHISICGV